MNTFRSKVLMLVGIAIVIVLAAVVYRSILGTQPSADVSSAFSIEEVQPAVIAAGNSVTLVLSNFDPGAATSLAIALRPVDVDFILSSGEPFTTNLTFTMPEQICDKTTGASCMDIGDFTTTIDVTNGIQKASHQLKLTANSQNSAPTLVSIEPTSAQAGETITMKLSIPNTSDRAGKKTIDGVENSASQGAGFEDNLLVIRFALPELGAGIHKLGFKTNSGKTTNEKEITVRVPVLTSSKASSSTSTTASPQQASVPTSTATEATTTTATTTTPTTTVQGNTQDSSSTSASVESSGSTVDTQESTTSSTTTSSSTSAAKPSTSKNGSSAPPTSTAATATPSSEDATTQVTTASTAEEVLPPTLTSISPSASVMRGDQIVLLGTGLMSPNDLYLDGKLVISGGTSSDDQSSLAMQVPKTVERTCLKGFAWFCKIFPSRSLSIGKHTISVHNSNGLSNELQVEVIKKRSSN